MRRAIATAVGVVVVLSAIAILPVLAAKPDKAAHVEKTPIKLTGTIQLATDADGHETYSLQSGGKTYTLEAGPAWFFGDKYPLKKFVGQSVTIDGEVAAGSTEVEVDSVNGTALRAPGKPPWAGGWKVVGAAHPGWTQAKVGPPEVTETRRGSTRVYERLPRTRKTKMAARRRHRDRFSRPWMADRNWS